MSAPPRWNPLSPEVVDRIRRFTERRLSAEEFDAYVHAPMSEAERREILESVARPLAVLQAAVLVILLIAIVNVATLLSSRASVRGREMAMRAALGATRARIARQLLTESVLLAAFGAGLGLLVAVWGLHSLLALAPASRRGGGSDGLRGPLCQPVRSGLPAAPDHAVHDRGLTDRGRDEQPLPWSSRWPAASSPAAA